MYTIDDFKKHNTNYDTKHGVTQKDVDLVNNHVYLIESTRTDSCPQPGDLLRCTDSHGTYYGCGRIERVESCSEMLHGCQDEFPWFTNLSSESKSYSLSLSGGPWFRVPSQGPKLIGKEKAGFKDWGHIGGSSSSITFKAQVNVWEYSDPNPQFPVGYNTKYWGREYMYFLTKAQSVEMSQFGYRIQGDGIAFHTQEEYLHWLNVFKGVVFDGYYPNQKIVFFYREKDYYIDREEWDALDLPLDTRMCNGIILCKFRYDDENHKIHTYRFTNDGSAIERHKYRPYERIRGTDLTILLDLI